MTCRGPAAVLTSAYGKPYTIEQRTAPAPKPGEALVRLTHSGICHGDVYSRDGGGPAPTKPVRPLTGGHEGVGRIVQLGGDEVVDDGPMTKGVSSSWHVGQRVGVAWRAGVCGRCDACVVGRENFCAGQIITGMMRDGTYQEYIVFPTDELHQIPETLSPLLACTILCAGVTAYTAISSMKPERGKWLAISGAAGALGHIAIQYARFLGLKVLAIDGGGGPDPKAKERFCRAMGATEYVDFLASAATGPKKLAEEVKRLTGGRGEGGVDYALVLSPHQSCYDDAGEYVRFGGQIVAVGVGSCHMPLRPLLQKAITLRSSQTGTKRDMQAALNLASENNIKGQVKVVRFDQLNQALDGVKAGEVMGKLVLEIA